MITSGLMTSLKDDWTTPKDFFNDLNNKYHFTLDACASDENHLCDKYYTKENSCILYSWQNEITFINPPYGKEISKFVAYCYLQALEGSKIIALLPSRTDTQWFHKYIYDKPNIRIEFIKGRLHFGDSKQAAPFPSMLVFYNL